MHSNGYIEWFYKVSHPLIIGPALVPEYTVPRPVYEEVIVEQQWARHPLDPFQIIGNIKVRVENAMGISDVVSNPLFLGILIWRAFSPIIPCLRRCRLHQGGVGVQGSSSRVLFYFMSFVYI